MNTIKNIANNIIKTRTWLLFGVIFALQLTGCASGPNANPTDPLEPFNRGVFSFNEGVDKVLLKPVAQGYQAVTPRPVRMGVTNFFNNLEDLWSSLNGVLQLRPAIALEDFMRFSVNTVFGLGGALDVATEMRMERHSEDLGKTLGRWGVPSGPYLVMPIFGPSTLRDALMIPVESRYDPVGQIDHTRTRNAVSVMRVVDTRANLLRLGNLLDEASLDKYSFMRDAHLQRRRAEIYRPGQEDDNSKPEAQDKK